MLYPIENAGSVGILSVAQEDWKPSVESSVDTKDEMPKVCIQVKARRETDALDTLQPSQADWIRQYVQQQEEVLYKYLKCLISKIKKLIFLVVNCLLKLL